MIPELGHFTLALAVAIAGAQAVLALWGAQASDRRLMAAGPALALGQFLAVATAFGVLMYCYAVSDFSVSNVAENSHSLKPMLYKLTGTWGNHEGSVLLWCTMLAGCGAAVAGFGRELPTRLRARVLGVLGLISAGFLLFALLTSNPFVRIWPPPADGQGLNPLLQDPGLAFHPPLLYAGYVGFSVAFAFAVAALIEGRIDAAWGRWVRPWTLAAWALLTCGIALGSWWAYYELGWGGYWFWDPVENASLLPWLCGAALLHSAIVVERREALRIWTVLLAIAAFSFSLLGTFLVRSGVLNSVHAFANDPSRGMFIIALLGLTIGGALGLFAWRAPRMAPAGMFATISRESALVLNNILLCSMAAVVATGTLYPLFVDLLFGTKLSVGAPFFNTVMLPLVVPLVVIMSFGPMMPWKRARLGEAARRLWPVALIAAAVGVVAAFRAAVLPALGFAGATWLVGGAVAHIGARTRFSLSRLVGLPRGAWGGAIAHAGLGITLAGIAGMALASEQALLVRPGETVSAGGYEWTLVGLRDGEGPNYTLREAGITVAHDGKVIATLAPERHYYPVQRMTTTEAAIHPTLLRDLYAVLGEERDGAAILRLYVNPLAPWIWLGALVMALGGALSLSDRRLRVGAPRRAAVPAEARAA